MDLQKRRLIIFKPDQRLVNHAHRALDLTEVAKQAERGGQLDQAFEKGFLGVVGFMVKVFPCFVAFEEFPVVKQTYAFSQPSVHRFSATSQGSNYATGPQ